MKQIHILCVNQGTDSQQITVSGGMGTPCRYTYVDIQSKDYQDFKNNWQSSISLVLYPGKGTA